MTDLSRFRLTPYRKPLWLRLTIAGLFLSVSLLLSQIILRDQAFMQTFIEAGQKVAEFVAVEKAHREAQAQLDAEQAAEQAELQAAQARLRALGSQPAPEPDVRVNRLAGPDGGIEVQGFKRVRVTAPD